MSTSARSIDAAARGYIRHRFTRALAASWVVGVMFLFIASVAGALIAAALQGDVMPIVAAPLSIPLVLIVMVAPTALAIALTGALIDLTHRRIVGFAMALLAALLTLFFAAGAGAVALQLAGVDMDFGDGRPPATTELAALAAFTLAGAFVSYELTRHGWWQTTARADDFRAVRGWRPLPFRLFTTFRRYVGLPGFLAHVGRKRLTVSLLYFGVAILNLGLLMLLLLPVMVFSMEGQATAEFDPRIMIGMMAALLLANLLGAGALLARLADKRATRLYQNVREWDARAPILFLRDFDQDKERLRAVGADPFARWPAGVGRPRTLDEILLEHASPYGPVIAIGDPRDPTPPLGAARVFVEGQGDEWQDVVRSLAGASKAVVMCPNHGDGVQWELDLIAQAGGRLQTIFLASPELDRDATLALFKRFVPDMPEIDPKQTPVAAYRCDGAWRVLTAKRLSVDSYTAALNAALQALFGMKGEAVKRAR
jgi:hypothetical protein